MRIFYLFSALAYTSIAYAAFKVLAGIASSSNDSAASNGSWLMQNQWGVYLFAAIGVIVLLFALIQFSHAIRRDFMDKFVNDMPSQTKQLIQHVGRLGFAARGVVYSLVGIFILHAAYTTDPDKAGGLDKAAQTVMQQPFGPWLLALLGLGLIGFGTFCGFEGRYRKTS